MAFYQPVPTKIDDSEMELFHEAQLAPTFGSSFGSMSASPQKVDTAPIGSTGNSQGFKWTSQDTGAAISAGGQTLANFGKMWAESKMNEANRNMNTEAEKGMMDLQSRQRTSMAGHNALTGLINAYRAALRSRS